MLKVKIDKSDSMFFSHYHKIERIILPITTYILPGTILAQRFIDNETKKKFLCQNT